MNFPSQSLFSIRSSPFPSLVHGWQSIGPLYVIVPVYMDCRTLFYLCHCRFVPGWAIVMSSVDLDFETFGMEIAGLSKKGSRYVICDITAMP